MGLRRTEQIRGADDIILYVSIALRSPASSQTGTIYRSDLRKFGVPVRDTSRIAADVITEIDAQEIGACC
jgi:hypothetical protein